MNILIAEDELIIAKVNALLLQKEGYTVKTVKTGKNAISILKEFCPDLIIMDVQFNDDLDGFECGKIIRKTHKTPIIFTTGNSKNISTVSTKSINNSWVLIKPVDFEEMLNLIIKIFK